MALGREELCDLLLELQHDLGKYLRQPLAYLPATASPFEVHSALCRALLETRRGPAGVRSARQLWTGFVEQAGLALRDLHGFARLERAVTRALAWETVARQPADALDRTTVVADLGAVEPAIRQLIEELHGRA